MKRVGQLFGLLTIVMYVIYTIVATVVIRILSIGIIKNVESDKGVLLTFDDGPNPLYTPTLLELLAQYNIQAIFFVVGHHAERHPEIIKQMIQAGHSVGIHHYEHHSCWKLTPAQTKWQIHETANVIERITGKPPLFYRPPFGQLNLASLFAARPFKTVIWTDILGDWKVKTCERHLLNKLRKVSDEGSIVVLHDDGTNPGADDEAPAHMIRVLEEYLKESAEKGVTFLKPSDLLSNTREKMYVD